MYRPELPAGLTDKESLCWLLQVADRFETPTCMYQCARRLSSLPLTLEDVVMYLNLPEPVKTSASVRKLIQAISELTSWSYEEITTGESIYTMSAEALYDLLCNLEGQSEHAEHLFRILLEWLRHDKELRWKDFSTLLPLLDLEKLSARFMREEMNTCPELRTPEGRALLQIAKKPKAAAELEVVIPDPAHQAAAAPIARVAARRGPGPCAGCGVCLLILLALGAIIGFMLLIAFSCRHSSKVARAKGECGTATTAGCFCGDPKAYSSYQRG